MKRTVTLLILLVVFATVTTAAVRPAAALVDLKGAWDMSIETPQGARPLALTIAAQEEDKFSGTMASPMGDIPVTGTVTGADVKFTGSFDAGGNALTLTFTGKIDGDTMGGDVDFGGFGQGTWSAKKK